MKCSPALPIVLALAASLGACSAPSGGAPDSPRSDSRSAPLAPPPADAFRPIASGDMLYLWSGGADALLVDPKDAGVRDALHHLGARLHELPAETGDPEFPAEAIELASAAFLGPMSLSVGMAEDAESGGIPVRAQFDFRSATPEEATLRAERLTRVLSKFEMPSLGLDEALGLSRLDFGMFEVLHGVAREGRADTLVVAANGLDVRERELGTLDLPAEVKPAMAFRFDYAALAEMIEQFAGPEAADALRTAGIGDVVIQGGFGHGADRSYGALRTLDWVPMATASHALPHGAIERAALALIPADATLAVVSRTNLASIVKSIRDASAASGEVTEIPAGFDPLTIVRELTGLDVERDLIANLGETLGAYLSDATGGGGYFSTVAFLEVADEAALRAALERLEGRLEDMAADEGLDGFTTRHSQHAGADLTTITVSGWPIPIEPSWAIRDGWLFASASVQGLRAALDQAAQSASDLLDNERFRAESRGSLDDLVTLSYVDIPRFAREGYPLAAMIGAALSNGLSSAGEPDRVPAGIVPGFAEFARGSHATLALGRIDGDDLVIQCSGDRSLLVQAAGIVGAMGPLPLLIAGMAAAGANDDDDESHEHDMEEGMDPMEDDPMSEIPDADAMQDGEGSIEELIEAPTGDPK
jgi:hypothetical protein